MQRTGPERKATFSLLISLLSLIYKAIKSLPWLSATNNGVSLDKLCMHLNAINAIAEDYLQGFRAWNEAQKRNRESFLTLPR